MSKIIIDNRSNISDIDALKLVEDVIEDGRVSDFGKSYCSVSVFTRGKEKTSVYARNNKSSDTFIVMAA